MSGNDPQRDYMGRVDVVIEVPGTDIRFILPAHLPVIVRVTETNSGDVRTLEWRATTARRLATALKELTELERANKG